MWLIFFWAIVIWKVPMWTQRNPWWQIIEFLHIAFRQIIYNYSSHTNKSSLQALDRFNSADDIRTFIEGQITEGVEEDARIAAEETERLAQNFCDSGCTTKTAQFLRKIFKSLHGGQCVDASQFCGDCQNRAEKWFKRSKNRLPCCIAEVVQKGIEVIENWCFIKYIQFLSFVCTLYNDHEKFEAFYILFRWLIEIKFAM